MLYFLCEILSLKSTFPPRVTRMEWVPLILAAPNKVVRKDWPGKWPSFQTMLCSTQRDWTNPMLTVLKELLWCGYVLGSRIVDTKIREGSLSSGFKSSHFSLRSRILKSACKMKLHVTKIRLEKSLQLSIKHSIYCFIYLTQQSNMCMWMCNVFHNHIIYIRN